MDERGAQVRSGDVIEFTWRGERLTAVAMLVSDEGDVLLDLLDDGALAWGDLRLLGDVAVFRPGAGETLEFAAAA